MTSAEWYKQHPEKYREKLRKNRAYSARARESRGVPTRTQVRCLECGRVQERDEALINGTRLFPRRRHRCICPDCL